MNHQCVSEHYSQWVLGIMIYKGILLLFGVFLAWETRNVHYAELNDSKNIGVAVYNILLFSVVSITTEFVLSNFLAKRIFNNSVILVCTTLVLCLVFLTKVWWTIFFKICIDFMYMVKLGSRNTLLLRTIYRCQVVCEQARAWGAPKSPAALLRSPTRFFQSLAHASQRWASMAAEQMLSNWRHDVLAGRPRSRNCHIAFVNVSLHGHTNTCEKFDSTTRECVQSMLVCSWLCSGNNSVSRHALEICRVIG